MPDVRVRIAPSPTGNLHVGTARTALFNALFAKAGHGAFVMRIEDTDLERSQADYEQNIYDSLHALGLQWDEGPDVGGPYGPYKQSQRIEIYQEWAERLLKEGKAYYSYETEAELEAERERAKAENRSYRYQRPAYSEEQLAAYQADPTRKPSLRFKVPSHCPTLVLNDLIRGEISFDLSLMDDFVIVKSNGIASYNFAVVIDDMLMRISHVIRGEDHISNTPKQLLLYEALGVTPPAFAHVGMILAPDRSKLSKRHGATAVSEFIQQGYLPEAFCNFLALLGWSPQDGEEVGTLDHFGQQFTLSRISPSPAIFEADKLNWFNGLYIRQLSLPDLLERARPFLNAFDLSQYPEALLLTMLEAVREKITILGDLPEHVSYFFGQGVILDAALVGEVLMNDEARQVLMAFRDSFLAIADFSSPETLSVALKDFTNTMKPLKTKTVMWAIRTALTGRTQGADLGKTLYLLGAERIRFRVEEALTLTAGSLT